jgi:putative hemolysin
LAALVAPPIDLIARVLRPVVWLLEGSAQVLLRPLGVREVIAGEGIRSAAELRALVDEAEGLGIIPRAQEELLHNVFDFATQEAGDVMVAAPDVAWLDAGLRPDAALDAIAQRPFSRYPIARGTLDHLLGVVHVRDLAAAARRAPDEPISALADSAPVVPITKDLGALLRELREARRHLAIVADEYGGTAGILTLEDILEEIVGEIEDEYDLPDDTLERLDATTVRAVGSITIDDSTRRRGPSSRTTTLALSRASSSTRSGADRPRATRFKSATSGCRSKRSTALGSPEYSRASRAPPQTTTDGP